MHGAPLAALLAALPLWAALLPGVAPPAPGEGVGQDLVSATVCTAALTRPRPAMAWSRPRSLLDGMWWRLRPVPGEGRPLVEPDRLLALVWALEPGAWDRPGARLEFLAHDRLVLRGTPAAVGRARLLVEDLEGALGRRARFEARLYLLEQPLSPPAVLPSSGLASLLGELAGGAGRLVWTGAGEAVEGEGLVLGVDRHRAFLADHDPEVAGQTRIADPQVWEAEEGLALALSPHFSLDGGRVLVAVRFQLAGPAGIQPVHPASLFTGALDRPSLWSCRMEAAAYVEPGGALCLVSDGPLWQGGEPFLLLVRVEAGPPPAPRSPGLALWPVGALCGPRPTGQLDHVFHAPPGPGGLGEAGRTEDPPESETWWNAEEIAADLLAVLAEAGGARGLTVEAAGDGHLVAFGEDEDLQQAGRLLVAMQEADAATWQAEWTVLGAAGGEGLDHASLAAGATRLVRLRLPVVAGREAFLLRGLESTLVGGYDPNIAWESGIADPVVQRTFEGLAARMRLAPAASGDMAEMDALLLGTRARRRHAEERMLGVMDLEERSRARFSARPRFTQGLELLLGEGHPVEAEGRRWRSLLRVALSRP